MWQRSSSPPPTSGRKLREHPCLDSDPSTATHRCPPHRLACEHAASDRANDGLTIADFRDESAALGFSFCVRGARTRPLWNDVRRNAAFAGLHISPALRMKRRPVHSLADSITLAQTTLTIGSKKGAMAHIRYPSRLSLADAELIYTGVLSAATTAVAVAVSAQLHGSIRETRRQAKEVWPCPRPGSLGPAPNTIGGNLVSALHHFRLLRRAVRWSWLRRACRVCSEISLPRAAGQRMRLLRSNSTASR